VVGDDHGGYEAQKTAERSEDVDAVEHAILARLADIFVGFRRPVRPWFGALWLEQVFALASISEISWLSHCIRHFDLESAARPVETEQLIQR